MSFDPIPERRVRLKIRLAQGRSRGFGRVFFALADDTVTARRGSETVASESVVAVKATGTESWRIETATGDVWYVGRDCGCGG